MRRDLRSRLGARRAASTRPGQGDDGFVLLESIVSIALISVLMAALTPFFATSINLMSRQRASQSATQIATSAVETLQGLSASDLVTGHDSASVATQFASPPAYLQTWLSSAVMTPAVDPSARAGAGPSAVVPTTPQVQTLNNIAYKVTTYLGRCQVPAGGMAADCTSATTTDSVAYVRAVVAVTWSQPRCPTSLCTYVTGTLFNATGDPIFDLQQAPASVPLVVNPGNQTSTLNTAITPLQLGVQPGTGVPTMTWALTAGSLPPGLALTTAGLVSGVPTALTATRSVTVTVTDAFQRTASATFTWAVVAAPTVASPGAQTTTNGAVVSLQLATTCANSPCAYVLNSGPAGLTISPAGVISGTVTSPAQTFSTVSVTVADAAGAIASSTPAFTWTVKARPSVTAPPNQTTGTGSAATPVTLVTSCPNSPCTYVLNNGPAGLSISAAGVISGTVTSQTQVFNVTVTITDAAGVSATSPVFTWTVLSKPGVAAPANQATTTGTAATSVTLNKLCPNSPCTYVLNNGPAGLTISTAGVISGVVTSLPQVFSNVSVTITDAGGATATSSPAFTWTVLARPTVTSPGPLQTTVGAAVNVSLTTTCPNTPCTYVLNSGPAGLAISAAGVISGTVTSPAQVFSTVSVTVTDAGGATASSATFTWTVLAKPSVTAPANQTTASGTAATAVTPVRSCPNAPCTFGLNSAPAGLTISTAGVISGTVTSPAQVFNNVSVTITDAAGVSATSTTFTWTVTYAALVATNPGPQKSTLNAPINPLQLTATGGSGSVTWSLLTPLPSGLTLSSSGLITGSSTFVGTTSVQVKATDSAAGQTSTTTFSWTVVNRPTIGSPGSLTATVGNTRSVPLTYTCPYAACTLTLTNGVPGLGLSLTTPNATNNTTSAIVVTGTGGTVYVNGVVQASAVTSGTSTLYAPVVTITDGANAATASTPGSWRIYVAATISSPGTLTATEGNIKSVPLTYSCPYASCTITLSGTVPGLGLTTNASATGNQLGTSLLVSLSSGTVYIAGTVQSTAVTTGASAVYTPTMQITDGGGTAGTPASGSWTIFAPPSLSAIGNRSVTITGTESTPLAYTCPSTPCTVSISNAVPGLGLSTSATSGTNTTTSLTLPSSSGTVYVNGVVGPTALPSGSSKPWSMTVTLSDSTGVAATTTGTWTAYPAPTITPVGSQAVEPGQNVALQVGASCPNGGCSYAAAAQFTGDPTWYPLTISATGLLTYNNAQPTGTYTIRVIVTDGDSVSTQMTFPLVVGDFSLAIPDQSTTAPRNNGTVTVTLDVSALINPTAVGYTYTLFGAPGWLTINASTGVLTASVTRSSSTDNSITVTVTSTASSTSTVSDTFAWVIR